MPFPRNLSQESRGCMASSDRSFECGHCKCLDDSLGWLGFHDNFLAEHHLLGCLCGWLSARLDPGESGDSEDACLLHFCLTKLCQRVQDFGGHTLFQFNTVCERVCNGALGHGLVCCCLFHCCATCHGGVFHKARMKGESSKQGHDQGLHC